MKRSSREIARTRFWNEHDRSEYECPDCGRSEGETYSGTFEVHHEDGNAYNNALDNLVGLCRLCHNLREGKRPSVGAVKALREGNRGKKTPQSTTEPSSGVVVKHIRKSIELMSPRTRPRNRTDANISWQLGDTIGYEGHISSIELTPKTRREVALWEKARWVQVVEIRDKLVTIEKFAGDRRCQQCGKKVDKLASRYDGPDDPDEWYRTRLSDYTYYCLDCHP